MILCFSGTGNSLYAAKIISSACGDEIISLNDTLKHGGPALYFSEKPWVVVSPVHGWRLPAAHRRAPEKGEVQRAAQDVFLPHLRLRGRRRPPILRGLCQDIGMDYMGLNYAVMPENYLAMFPTPDAEEAGRIIQTARPGIEAGRGGDRRRQSSGRPKCRPPG